MRLERLDAAGLRAEGKVLVELLVSSVDAGAGVGFLAPLAPARAEAYWEQVARELEAGQRVLVAARDDAGALVGCAQLELATRETGLHRAEVQKLLVHPRARGRGIARLLMERVEAEARERGRTLLLLDTFEGTLADGMYRRWGWRVVGTIPRYALDPERRLRTLVLFSKELEDGGPGGG